MTNNEWRYMTIGELTVNYDAVRVPVKETDRRPGPYPYYGASDVVDNVDNYIFDGEYLLIAEDGENLRTRKTPAAFMAKGKFWVNNHAHIVQGNAKADTRFLLYALALADIGAYLTGSTMPKLTQANLNHIPIHVPPLPEQRAIASILGALDDKIDLNRRMNETLEAIARALFTSWFVDFDPVRAKMEGRQPAGMDVETAALFPASFMLSPFGQIPNGWKFGSIYDIAHVVYGAAFASNLFNTEQRGLPLIRIRDLAHHTPEIYTPEIHPRQAVMQPGDIVVGMDGEFRAHHWKGPASLLNQRVCSFVPKSDVPRWFLSQVIQEPLMFFERSKTGTTVIHLGKADIDTFRLIIPPPEVLDAYGLTTDPLLDRLLINAKETITLTMIRDTLLPKLLSGEVRAQEAERELEAVLWTRATIT